MDEGPVFAMCMTSQGDQAVLNQWITGLQQTNPILGQVPTLFRLDAGPRQLQGAADAELGGRRRPDPEEMQPEEEEESRRSWGMKQ